jgi:hypothetical protein
VSDQRAADGEGDGRRQKKANETTDILLLCLTFPGVCEELTPEGCRLRPVGVNFSQSPANHLPEQRSFIEGTERPGAKH